MSVIISSETPTARKNHVCNWCGLQIKAGSKYQRSANVCDGEMYTWKNHLECMAIAHQLNMFDDCDEGVTESDFQESIISEYQNIMVDNYLELYQSNNYRIPPFDEQLKFVFDFYRIENALAIETKQ